MQRKIQARPSFRPRRIRWSAPLPPAVSERCFLQPQLGRTEGLTSTCHMVCPGPEGGCAADWCRFCREFRRNAAKAGAEGPGQAQQPERIRPVSPLIPKTQPTAGGRGRAADCATIRAIRALCSRVLCRPGAVSLDFRQMPSGFAGHRRGAPKVTVKPTTGRISMLLGGRLF